MSEDLDALLGAGFTENLKNDAERMELQKAASSGGELSLPEVEDVEMDVVKNHIVLNTADMVRKTNEAITTVVAELQASPNDPNTMAGLSALLRSYSALLGQFNKTNELYEKMKHQKQMLAMKLTAEKTMNDDNNETMLTMTREQLFAQLKENSVKVD